MYTAVRREVVPDGVAADDGGMVVMLLHILFVGIFLGIAGSETVVELMGRDPDKRAESIRLHYRIDLAAEIPVLVVAIGSGVWLAVRAHPGGWALVHTIAGAVGLGATSLAVVAVIRRRGALVAGDQAALDRAQRAFQILVLIAIPAVLLALGIAFARAA